MTFLKRLTREDAHLARQRLNITTGVYNYIDTRHIPFHMQNKIGSIIKRNIDIIVAQSTGTILTGIYK
jgi:hypothetical protein